MKYLLKINDFAQLAGVTPRLLRHYDSVGLFRPAHIDHDSGYRYYRPDQLPALHRILSLRTLGIPLHEIAATLEADLSPDALVRTLREQARRLETSIAREQSRLSKTRSRIHSLEAQQSVCDVVIKPLLPLQGLRLRTTLQRDESIPNLFAQLSHTLSQQGLYRRVRAIMGIYPRHALLEHPIAFPFPFEALYIMPTARLRSIPLNAERMLVPSGVSRVAQAACILHVGPYDRLFDSYRALLTYIRNDGYQIAGEPREVYLQQRTADRDPITEIQIPISRPASVRQ